MIYLHKLLPELLSPLIIMLYLTILAIFINKKWPLIFLIFFLIIFSSPIFSRFSISIMEREYPPSKFEKLPTFSNIVILSGMVRAIPMSNNKVMYEFNESVDRIIAAIKIKKIGKTKNIILTNGSGPWSLAISKGEYLQKYLIENYINPEDILLTEQVYNTEQEAEAVSKIITNKEMIGLVTSSYHMPRAIKIFSENGLNVYPIPVDFIKSYSKFTFFDFLPSAESLKTNSQLIREMMGRIYYSLKFSNN
jgi:uncharacterized SAM-binding protein YcdF (DUF218 family)